MFFSMKIVILSPNFNDETICEKYFNFVKIKMFFIYFGWEITRHQKKSLQSQLRQNYSFVYIIFSRKNRRFSYSHFLLNEIFTVSPYDLKQKENKFWTVNVILLWIEKLTSDIKLWHPASILQLRIKFRIKT